MKVLKIGNEQCRSRYRFLQQTKPFYYDKEKRYALYHDLRTLEKVLAATRIMKVLKIGIEQCLDLDIDSCSKPNPFTTIKKKRYALYHDLRTLEKVLAATRIMTSIENRK